ncbi:P-loop containing nucleoside triphosphate hydrolase protein, partial [Mycena olivaceomarginata]
MYHGSQNSWDSFSLLPAKPKIFHGRESELTYIVETLQRESARIAILGPGGMGKTCLVKAALHHPDIIGKYEHCFFIAADSATSSLELAALIGSHIGLKPAQDLTNPVVSYLSGGGSSLLVLDNLETIWEPTDSRHKVEEFLSILTEIAHLALIITMRGAERPAKVRWTHPFLPPLQPLSDDAAWQTFVDIAEDYHDSDNISQILSFTDNMPLAVDLIAHLVDSEGFSNVLSRWEAEKTSMLSEGYDQRSNLDASIVISLSSPRMSPDAKVLLSLLSILPDGLSDVELVQSKLPIQDVLRCKSILLVTSLAYTDDKRRLKSLVPIREHMQHFYPVPATLVNYPFSYFHSLLNLYEESSGL